jgi:hypothetical protein
LLHFLGPLVTCVKELASGLRCLDALICYCQQVSHDFWLLHGDLLNSLDLSDPVTDAPDEVELDVPAEGWKIATPIGYPCEVMTVR